MHWYLDVLRKYATFTGRARREEFWMFALVNLILSVLLMVVDGVLDAFGFLSIIYSLALFLPGLAVAVRRLHDTGRSGWWILVAFVPLAGAIVLLVFLVSDSAPHPNAYGPNPKIVSHSPQAWSTN